MTPSIAAIVVTHNRLALLRECLAAVRAQTHALTEIIVVDNASSDGTAEWLRAQIGLTVITQANLGSGGGQHAGIGAAMVSGHGWAWCMDDDGIPALDALEKMMPYVDNYDFLNCLVLDAKDKSRLAHGVGSGPFRNREGIKTTARARELAPVIQQGANPFNGTLISRRVVETVGLPHPALFIWGDEIEYLWRAEKAGLRIGTVVASEFYHPSNAGNLYDGSALKLYYLVRNASAYATDDGKSLHFNARAAFGAARRVCYYMLTRAHRQPLTSFRKCFVALRAAWAAIWQNKTL